MAKKILIISNNAFSLHRNNGKTLSSIFSGWDNSCIAQLFFNEEVPESEKFTCFFKLSDKSIVKEFFCGRGDGESGEVVFVTKDADVLPDVVTKNDLHKHLTYFLSKFELFKLLLRDFIYGSVKWNSGKLKRWIEEFKPDSIFLVGGNYNFPFDLASLFASQLKIPLDVFITDNYVLNQNSNGILNKVINNKLLTTYRTVFSSARHVFAIGTDMADAFSYEFNRPFVPIMNSVKFSESSERASHELRYPGVIDIVYAGGLHLGRSEAIIKFGDLLSRVSNKLGLDATLVVYSSSKPENKILEKFSRCGVKYGGSLNHSDVESRMKIADFVLHVESFDMAYTNLTKLSISTKIPEYLASGACVIAFGPSDLSSIRLIVRNKIGIGITENDNFQQIFFKLKCVFESSIERKKISQAGYLFAKNNFDVEIIRNCVNNLLNTNLR